MVTGCGALGGSMLISYRHCRAPFLIPFMSTSDGFWGCPLFFQLQSFPHRLSKISSFPSGLFHHGNSWPPTSLCSSEGLLKSSSHLPQCYVVFPVAMAGIKTCQGRRVEGQSEQGKARRRWGRAWWEGVGGWNRNMLSASRREEGFLFHFLLFWFFFFFFFGLGLFLKVRRQTFSSEFCPQCSHSKTNPLL